MTVTSPWPTAASLFVLFLFGLALLLKGLAESSVIVALLGIAVLTLFVRFCLTASAIRRRASLRNPKQRRL